MTTVGDGTIEVREHPDPQPGPGEVLVRVAGAGLNRADLMQRAGFYPAPPGSPPDIPGLEFAGTVVALGEGVEHPTLGTSVFGITGGGAQAELVTVPAGQCATVPGGPRSRRDGRRARGVRHRARRDVHAGRRRAGEWVLVHAVGSGCRHRRAATREGARSARRRHVAQRGQARAVPAAGPRSRDRAATGADGTLDVAALAAEITRVTGRGADVVLDLVAGAYVEADVAAAAPGGRIVLIGTLAGGTATLQILTVMQRRLRLFGTVLRTRSVAEKTIATDAFVRDVVPFLADRTPR